MRRAKRCIISRKDIYWDIIEIVHRIIQDNLIGEEPQIAVAINSCIMMKNQTLPTKKIGWNGMTLMEIESRVVVLERRVKNKAVEVEVPHRQVLVVQAVMQIII